MTEGVWCEALLYSKIGVELVKVVAKGCWRDVEEEGLSLCLVKSCGDEVDEKRAVERD